MPGTVHFKIQIRSPGTESCILFEEDLTTTITNSQGLFSIAINGSGTRIDTNSWSFDDVMSNRQNFAAAPSACLMGTTGYTPGPDDGRVLSVWFQDATMGSYEAMPRQAINYVPMAIESKTVAGYGTGNILKIETPNPSTTLSAAQFTNLLGLVNGSSNLYVNSSTGAGAAIPQFPSLPSTLTPGSMWYDSTTHQLKYYDGTSPVIVGSSSGGSGGISSFNSQTNSVQSFGAISLTGTNPLWTSSSGVHTLSIPMANSIGVGAGLLSNSDYNNFSGKLGAGLASGSIFVGNSSGVATAVAATGDVLIAGDGSTTLDKIRGRSIAATTPVDGQVLRFASSTWTPNYLSMADIRSTVTPTNTIFPATSCLASQTLTWSSLTDTFVCSSIQIASSQVSYGTSVNAGYVFAGPATGGTGAPSFRALVASDIPGGAGSQWTTSGSNIFYNLGSVGVGTSNPTANFYVIRSGTVNTSFSPSNGDLFVAQNSGLPGNSAKAYITSGLTSNSALFLGSEATPTAGGLVYGSTANSLNILTNSTNRITIDSGGLVGIGSTTPIASLDVVGLTTANSAIIVPRATLAARPVGVNGMIRYNTDSNKFEGFSNAAWADLAMSGSGGGASQWTTTGSKIYYSSGNVGIGTNNPLSPLHIQNSVVATYTGTGAATNPFASNQGAGLLQLSNPATSGSSAVGINFTSGSTAVGESYVLGLKESSGNGALALGVGNGSGYIESLRLSSNGRVGVGSTVPQAMLDVAADTTSSRFLSKNNTNASQFPNFAFNVGGAGNGMGMFYAGNDLLGFSTTSLERMRIDADGRVGIGTTTPLAALDLVGTTSANSAIIVPRANLSNRPPGINGMIRYNTDSNKLEAFTANSWADLAMTGSANQWAFNGSRIYSVGTGAVGIGITNPYTKLHVAGSDSTVYTAAGSTSEAPGNFTVRTLLENRSAVDGSGAFLTVGAQNSAFNVDTAYFGALSTASDRRPSIVIGQSGSAYNTWNELMRFTPDGNVGIGTSTPLALLDLVGTTSANSAIIVPRANLSSRPPGINGMIRYNTSSNKLEAFTANAWSDLAMTGSGGGASQWTTSGSNIYYLNGTGLVGIGTNAPGNALHVVGSAGYGLNVTSQVQNTNGNGSAIMSAFSGATALSMTASDTGSVEGITTSFKANSYTNVNMNFAINNNTFMTLTSSGLGVGTTVPMAMLDVYGTASTNSAILVPRASLTNRPSGVNGMLRYNTSSNKFEGFAGNAWSDLAMVGTGGGSSAWATNASTLYYNGGNVGIGTSTAATLLDIYSTSADASILIHNDRGDLPAGINIVGNAPAGTNGANMIINTDPTIYGGAGVVNMYNDRPLTLKTQNTFRMTVASGSNGGGVSIGSNYAENNVAPTDGLLVQGRVGIGSTSPTVALDVVGDINATGNVRAAGVTLTSDLRFKRNIQVLDGALAKILRLRGVRYQWRTEEFPSRLFNSREQLGVIAQEVEEEFPEAVDTAPDGYKSVNYPALISPLIESTKSLHNEVLESRHEIEKLKIDNSELKKQNELLREQNNDILQRLIRLEQSARK